MLYRIKPYIRLDTALTAVILIGFVGVGYLFTSVSNALNESTDLGEQQARAELDLQAQKAQTATVIAESARKQQELVRRRAQSQADRQAASVSSLTSFSQAEALGKQLVDYAVGNGLDIVGSQSARGVASIGGIEFPTFTYSFEARGSTGALTGLLGLADDTPTTRIEILELTRESGEADVWNMKLGLLVPYGEG
jgi:multidrug efflux pump subunit AcrA (membrane-fusion protein)